MASTKVIDNSELNRGGVSYGASSNASTPVGAASSVDSTKIISRSELQGGGVTTASQYVKDREAAEYAYNNETYDIKSSFGTYRMTQHKIDWIANRYKSLWGTDKYRYYDDEAEKQNKAEGGMPKYAKSKYWNNAADRMLLKLGLPASIELDNFSKDYDDYFAGGVNKYASVNGYDDFSKFAQTKASEKYGYLTTQDDLLRQSQGKMSAKQEAAYKDKYGNFNSAQDEYNFEHNLPPVAYMDTILGEYGVYSQRKNSIDIFYNAMSAACSALENNGIENSAEKEYDYKGQRLTGAAIWEQTFVNALNSDDWADLHDFVLMPEKKTDELDSDDYPSVADLGQAKIAQSVKEAEKAAKVDAYEPFIDYDDFMERYPELKRGISKDLIVDIAAETAALGITPVLSEEEQKAQSKAARAIGLMNVSNWMQSRAAVNPSMPNSGLNDTQTEDEKQAFDAGLEAQKENRTFDKIFGAALKKGYAEIGTSAISIPDAVSLFGSNLEVDDTGKLTEESITHAVESLKSAGASANVIEQASSLAISGYSRSGQNAAVEGTSNQQTNLLRPDFSSVATAAELSSREMVRNAVREADVRDRTELAEAGRAKAKASGMTDLEYDNMLRRMDWEDTIDPERAARNYYIEAEYRKDVEAEGDPSGFAKLAAGDQLAAAAAVWDGFAPEERARRVELFERTQDFNADIHKSVKKQVETAVGGGIFARVIADIGSGAINLADMVAGIGGDHDRSGIAKAASETAARIGGYGRGSRDQGIGTVLVSGATDVATELVKMFTLNGVGSGLANMIGGTASGAAARLATTADLAALNGMRGSAAVSRGLSAILGALPKAAGSAGLIGNAAGHYFAQAMEEGADRQQATIFATVCGILEGATEKLNMDMWTSKALGGERLAKQVLSGAKSISNAGLNAKARAIHLVAGALGEFGEESLSYVGEWFMKRQTYDPNAKFDFGEMFESGLMGALVGFAGAGLSMGSYNGANVVAEYMLNNKVNADALDLGFISVYRNSISDARAKELGRNPKRLSSDDYSAVLNDITASNRQLQSGAETYEATRAELNATMQSSQAIIDAAMSNPDISATDASASPEAAASFGDALEKKATPVVREAQLRLQKAQTDLVELDKTHKEATYQQQTALAKAQKRLDGHFVASYDIFLPEIEAMRKQQDPAAINVSLSEKMAALRSGTYDEYVKERQAKAEAAQTEEAARQNIAGMNVGDRAAAAMGLSNDPLSKAGRMVRSGGDVGDAMNTLMGAQESVGEQTPINAGRVTRIQNPYQGDVPTQETNEARASVPIGRETINRAITTVNEAENSADDTHSVRSILKDNYKQLLSDSFGNKEIEIPGLSFGGAPYLVRLPNSVIAKVVSDPHMSIEKFAALEVLPEIIRRGEYVGSGTPTTKDGKKANVIRYDYFESSASVDVNGKPEDFVVSFDVEAYTYQNRFRTYRLNDISLTPVSEVLAGSVPVADGNRESSFNSSIPNSTPKMQAENSQAAAPAQGASFIEQSVGARKANPGGWTESRVSSNTMNVMFDSAERAAYEIEGDEYGYQRQAELQSIARARDSLTEAEQSGSYDALYNRLTNPATAWDAVDNDTAMGLVSIFRQSGDLVRMREILHAIQEHGTQAGQLVQSFAKYSRTPEGQLLEAEKNVANAEKNATPKQKQRFDATTQSVMDAVDAAVADGADPDTLRNAVEKASNKKVTANLQDALQRYANGELTREQLNDFITNAARKDARLPSFTLDQSQEFLDLLNKADAETDEHSKKTYYAQAAQLIADTYHSKGEKGAAVRRIAMLLNPKTGMKNFASNVPMAVLETAKDVIGTPIDMLASKITGKRTTTAFSAARYEGQVKGFAHGMTDAVKDIKTGVQTSELPGRYEVDARSRVFESSFMNNLNNAVGLWMQLGDRAFARSAYESRVGELGSLGYDVNSKEVADDAALYALDRVFQNNSALAKRASAARKSMGEFGNLLLPFVQTPANIADKLLDYSPAGLARIGAQLGKAKKTGEFDQKLFVDRCSRCITGTGIMALGAAMFAKGIITKAGEDREEKEAIKNAGAGEYSIKIGDRYHTINWAEPAGALLIIGAGIYSLLGKDGVTAKMSELNGWEKADTILAAGVAGVNAFASNSFLSSLANALAYNDTLGDVIVDTVINSTSQYTPSVLSAVARVADEYERDTYDPSALRAQAKYLVSRVPGLRNLLPVRVGADGELVKNRAGNTVLERVVQTALIPGYATQETDDAVNKEIFRLYVAGYTDQVLPDAEKKLGGRALTAEERREYQKDLGRATHNAAVSAMQEAGYVSASDPDKVDMLADAIDSAKRGVTKSWKSKIKNSAE